MVRRQIGVLLGPLRVVGEETAEPGNHSPGPQICQVPTDLQKDQRSSGEDFVLANSHCAPPRGQEQNFPAEKLVRGCGPSRRQGSPPRTARGRVGSGGPGGSLAPARLVASPFRLCKVEPQDLLREAREGGEGSLGVIYL